MNIEILGVNRISDGPFNALITEGRSLPWLQDTSQSKVWEQWQVEYRDVWILNSKNELVGVFNLSDLDLALAENRDALRKLLLDSARVVDADQDQLPDDWEALYFGGRPVYPTGDEDGDGIDNFSELAFGTHPLQPTSRPLLRVAPGPDWLGLTFTLRRPAGHWLSYTFATSPQHGLGSWNPVQLTPQGPGRVLYDGTGTMEITYSFTPAPSGNSSEFIRIKAAPRTSSE